jgi:hypothetical protein
MEFLLQNTKGLQTRQNLLWIAAANSGSHYNQIREQLL